MSIEMLLVMLMSTSVFDMLPFQEFFASNNTFTYLLLMMAYLYMKYMGFSFRPGIQRHLTPLVLIAASMFLSFIPAYLYYGQHLYHSLVVYRRALVLLFYPLLLSICPTVKECRAAFFAYGFIYAIFSFLGTYVHPEWVKVTDGMENIITNDLLKALPGLHFVVFSLIFALEQYRSTFRRKYLLMAIFYFVVIFLAKNRTILLASVLVITCSVLFGLKLRTRVVAEILLVVFFLALLVLGWTYISELLERTFLQLQDDDYNRVKAFNYFIAAKNGPLSVFLGNGFISGNVSSIMDDLRHEGIYNSDLGLIGLWHQFGLLFPLTVLYYAFRGFSRDHVFHVRAMSVMMFASTMTMAYFFTFGSMIWLCFFLYFSATDQEYYDARDERKKRIAKQSVRKYRSLI